MAITYGKIKDYEYTLHIKAYTHFKEQLDLFDEMMAVYLEPLDEIGRNWQSKEEKSPQIMLLARMFNDFESSRFLLLNGLPEQATMTMRDIIESSMLFRLFGKDPNLALRWMYDLKEYHPKNAKAQLDKLHVKCPEYQLYGYLSQLAHVNLLSALPRVAESKLTDDLTILSYNFGGMNNPTWIGRVLKNLLLIIFTVLWSVLPESYSGYLKNPQEWHDKVTVIGKKIEQLMAEFQIEEDDADTGEGKIMRDRVFRKLTRVKAKAILFDEDEIVADKGFPAT